MTYTPKNFPAWKHRVDQFNAGSNQPPVTVDQFIQQLLEDEEARYAIALKISQREALIPVADEILDAPPDKQDAAIAAALREVRL